MTFSGSSPDYSGGGLVNLIAEVEGRLGGSPRSPGLRPDLAASIPDASTYVIVLFDGLGDTQLTHSMANGLRAHRIGAVDAPFPSTTTVSLSTISTGVPPSQHGLIGYQLYLPELKTAVNTIRWTTQYGEPVHYDTTGLLPAPNTWERLTAAGVEPISIQPAHFLGSQLSDALYRGSRFEGVTSMDETIEAATTLARRQRRLIFIYLPHVDFAAHVAGQDSDEYDEAMSVLSWAWEQMLVRMPDDVCMIGTADHGHVDFPEQRRIRIPKRLHANRVLYGDVRAMFVKGDGASMAEELPATWVPIVDARPWWGPGPDHSELEQRLPDGVLVADDDHILLARHSNDRLVGNHGALTDDERRVPVLVGRDDG